MNPAEAVKKQHAIQDEINRADKARGPEDKSEKATQAGARTYPAPPFPAQHQKKPGDEAARSRTDVRRSVLSRFEEA
jgi:hypothetical protein